jgi:hypothetical protein
MIVWLMGITRTMAHAMLAPNGGLRAEGQSALAVDAL